MRFPEVRLQSEIAERERKQREEQTQKILRVKFERVQKEVEEHADELEALLREMDGCFDILMPRDFDAPPAAAPPAAPQASVGKGKEKATDDDGDESFDLDKYAADEDELEWESVDDGQQEEDEDEEEVDDVLRRHGIGSGGAYELNISFDKSFASMMDEENDDDGGGGGGEERDGDEALKTGNGDQEERQETSKPVAECLRNNLRAVTRRYGPLVDEWYDVALKVDFPLPNTESAPTSQGMMTQRARMCVACRVTDGEPSSLCAQSCERPRSGG
jgi:hypothetical protein